MTPQEFEHFRHEAVHQLIDLNARCEGQFSISSWPRWDYDLDESTLTFSEGGIPRVIASIVAVGTTSSESQSWLWAWANESIPHQAWCRLAEVQTFGRTEGLSALTTDHLPDDEYLGWEMSAIVARILGSKGAYRCPDETGFLYVVYSDLRLVA